MGSPDAELDRRSDEGPVRQVRVAYGVAVGKFEVTVSEFSRFVEATGYKTEAEEFWVIGKDRGCRSWDSGNRWTYKPKLNWKNPGFPQGADHPVVCVSWNDAQAYLRWLNGKSPGKHFRLLTEAEWEYAARAGRGATRYPWGDDPEATQMCAYANVLDASTVASQSTPVTGGDIANCNDSFPTSAPGAGLRPNAFGLYNMHGNAWEWVLDAWRASYQGAPTDGSEWAFEGRVETGVARGGSGATGPTSMRSAYRARFERTHRGYHLGFRVAKSL
jgi:formylglycine-generating enzyme required for sulfatase activity